MTTDSALELAFYGDDFTGSTDALEWLSRAGWRTMLFFAPPTPEQLRRYPNLQAIGVAGRTRALPPDELEQELRPVLQALHALGPRHVHYKVCSTFDSSPTVGSIGRAIDVAASIFRNRFVPLVVGAPGLGRYCVFGNLFARMGIGSAGSIYRLDRHPSMSRHPVTPADESDLRLHLSRQTDRRIGLFDILQYEHSSAARTTELERLIDRGAEIVLFDVLSDEHLRCVGEMLNEEARANSPLFSVGSSAIEYALAGAPSPQCQMRPAGAVESLLVVSGSCSPVTEEQITWACAHGFESVAFPARRYVEGGANETAAIVQAVSEQVTAQVRARRSVIVHTLGEGREEALRGAANRLGAALGAVAVRARETAGLRRLLVAGGDTSSYVARALQAEAIEMIAPLAPGAPLCRVHAPGRVVDGLEVNVKGGQVGAADYFGWVQQGWAEAISGSLASTAQRH